MPRLKSLDGLRAIAVGVITVFHSGYIHIMGGWLGVDVFFVLSGYLITTIILTSREKNVFYYMSFIWRRTVRLFPALLVVALASAYFQHLRHPGTGGGLRSAATALFYIMDYANALELDVSRSALSHTWSLAVEEKFYLIWPIVVIALSRFTSPKKRIEAVVAVILLAPVLRYIIISHGPGLAWAYFAFDCRIDQILIGCAMAMILSNTNALEMPHVTPFIGFLCILALATFSMNADHANAFVLCFGLPVSGILSALLITSLLQNKDSLLSSILSTPVLAWVGRISYGIYLWHFPIMFALRDLGYSPEWVMIGGSLGAIAIATVSFYAIELPVLGLISRPSTQFSPIGSPASTVSG
jgi:peptidoglycan/LPS O-acetylase OafA/YrhL